MEKKVIFNVETSYTNKINNSRMVDANKVLRIISDFIACSYYNKVVVRCVIDQVLSSTHGQK